MAPRYWFLAKRYGWGWGLPTTWEGWVFFLAWLAATTILSPVLALWHPVACGVFIVVMVALILGVCYATGEPPRWRWGD